MRFLIDAQLPPALARLLREHGHEADHVTDIGPGNAPDQDLWRYALGNEAVVVTKDEDFSSMIARGGETPAVVWVRIGNTRRPVLLAWHRGLRPAMPAPAAWRRPGQLRSVLARGPGAACPARDR
jgi:predicted nuclease of predicted toxin-antitoxin system